MSVDAITVRRIAHLARIAVKDDEVEHLKGEINDMLAFVEQLSEVDVSGVEPMTSVTPMSTTMPVAPVEHLIDGSSDHLEKTGKLSENPINE